MATGRTGWRAHPIGAPAALALTTVLALLMLLGRDHSKAFAGSYQTHDQWLQANTDLHGSALSIAGDITNPTREADEPLLTGLHTTWFKWKAPSNGTTKLDTGGSKCDNGGLP